MIEQARLSPPDALKGFLIVAFVATGQWTMLSRIGIGVVLLGLLLVALEWKPEWFTSATWAPIDVNRRAILPAGLTPSAVAIGAAACAPAWWHLYVTRGHEFGFVGDEPYHFSAARAYALQVRSAGPWLAALAVAVAAAVRFMGMRRATLVFFAGLFALSLRFAPHFVYARYPATFYLLALPLNVAAYVFDWRSPWLANHLTNALSLPAWLFVLRPLVVRRWPDVALLPVIALLLFQKDIIWYTSTAVIEPWAFVLWLTAAEAAVVLDARYGWAALMIAATAALVKETTIFMLPPIFLLSGGIDFAHRRLDWRAAAYAVALLAPFAVFYVARRWLAPIRIVGLASWGEIAAQGRIGAYLAAIRYQYGATGMVLLALLAVWWVAAALFAYRRDGFALAAHLVFGATAVALVAFFWVDRMAIVYTGYGRWMLLSLLAVSAAVLVGSHRFVATGQSAIVVAAAIAIAALQAKPTASALALDLRPDYARNSREWPLVPTYFPIRALTAQLPDVPGADAVRRVRIVTFGVDASIAPHVYPDIEARYRLLPDEQPTSRPDCRCRAADEAVLGAIQYRTLLATEDGRAGDPLVDAAQRECMAQAQRTCAQTRTERHDDGSVVGVLGVGVRHQ